MRIGLCAAGLLTGTALASGAWAQSEDQFGLLLPQPGTAGVDYKFGVEGRLEEESGLGQVDVFVPLSADDNSAFFLNGGGRYRFDIDDEDDDDIPDISGVDFDFDFDDDEAWSAFLGGGYRTWVGDSTVLGANAYLEGGQISAAGAGDDDDDFYMATVGGEYQQVFDFESATTLNVGINGYIPFEDYTDFSEPQVGEAFTLNGRSPRLGADVYATLGTNFTGADVRLEGTVGGFYYEGQDDNDDFAEDVFDFEEGDDLPGAVGEVALTYYGIDGFNLKGTGGVRWADYSAGENDDVEWYAGLRGEFTWGGDREVERTVTRTETVPGSAVVPERDCAVVRDADGTSRYDCSQRVVASAGEVRATKGTKGTVYEAEPLPPQPSTTRTVTETVTDTVPGLPVPNPRRHIGWGDPLVPYNFDVTQSDELPQ